MGKPKEWSPILGKPYFESHEYGRIYNQEFINEVIEDFKITDETAKKEIAEYLLHAASYYEIKKDNYHNFYRSRTICKKQLNEFKTGLNKNLKALKNLRTQNGKLAFSTFMFALKRRYLKDKPDILNTDLIHPRKISLSELDRLENFLELFLNSCNDALLNIEKYPKMNPTDPIEDWLRPIRAVWIKHDFPVSFTEGNPDYADYSTAVKILHKIICKIDPDVEIETIAGVVKRTKNIDLM